LFYRTKACTHTFLGEKNVGVYKFVHIILLFMKLKYRMAHLRVALVSSTIATHLGIEKAIFIKATPLAYMQTLGT
jgi:hypothetical protein